MKSFFVYPDSVKPSPACFVALVTFTVFNSVSGVPNSSYSKWNQVIHWEKTDLELQKQVQCVIQGEKKKLFLSVYIFYLPPTVHTNMCACKYNFGQNFLYTVPWLNRACNPYSRITLGYHEVFEKLLFFKYFLDAAVEFDQFLLQIARILSVTFVPLFLQYGSNDAINYKEMKHCLVFIRPWQCGLCLTKQEIAVPASVLPSTEQSRGCYIQAVSGMDQITKAWS